MSGLLVISPTLRVGGLAEHARCLALGAQASGTPMELCVTGIVDDVAFPDNCEVSNLDVRTASGLRALAPRVRDADCVLLLNSPETAAAVPVLALAKTAAVGVHGTPWTNAAWLGARRHALVTGACRAMPCLPLLIPAERDRAGVAEEFGVSLDRVRALPNAIDINVDSAPAAPTTDHLLLVSRLSSEKTWLLNAAIDCANATGKHLSVVGVGPNTPQWRAQLESTCRSAWALVEDADIRSQFDGADVVIAAGLIAMEATLAGRRVIVPCKAGGWAGVVTPESFDRLRDSNFVDWQRPTVTSDAADVYARACALTAQDLLDLADRVRHEASPDRMFARLLALSVATPIEAPQELAAATADALDDCEQAEAKVHADYAVVAEVRDYFRDQASNWEAAYHEVVPESPDPPEAAEDAARSTSTSAGVRDGQLRGREDRSCSPASPSARYRLTQRCAHCRDTPISLATWATGRPSSITR